MAVGWLKIHADGPDHGWEDGADTALCGLLPDGDLLDGEDNDHHRCHGCLIAHGTQLADVQGDASWRP